jgi:Flp pilus assembly pilin Flp
MKSVISVIEQLAAGDEGQDLLEYGLMAVLIAVVAVASIRTLGTTIYSVFWEVIARGF